MDNSESTIATGFDRFKQQVTVINIYLMKLNTTLLVHCWLIDTKGMTISLKFSQFINTEIN